MMHKSATTSWVRIPSAFIPAPELGRPPAGSSPVIHFFRDQETGDRWIGKLGQVPLRDKEVIRAAQREPGFLGMYADEILEKLGLAVYQLLGTEVPESALSYQPVTMEAMHPGMLLAMQLNAEDEGRVFELPHSPRMHYMARYVDECQPLDKDFVEHYLVNAKGCGNEYVKIQTCDGELLPLRGLGSMLAAANFVYDLDCLGDSCRNAGYVIREDAATGERYAQLVKIDAGYAFSYSDLRTDQRHNSRDRQIQVAPNQLRLQFADLAPADQKEFKVAAKRILDTPYEEFAHLFAQTEEIKEGLTAHHWQQLLDELIARKCLFLKAFTPETDRTIVKEIEAAQAKVAKRLEHTEEVSAQTVEEILAQENEEALALAELPVSFAVLEYVEHHLGRESKDAVVKLLKLLGCFPLAISQAVSYIKAGHSTLDGFEEQYYLNQASLLSYELLEEEDYPKIVGTTLTLCLAQAKVKSPLVEKLLGVLAYFAADGINVDLVARGLEVSKEEVDKALTVLESYSLVSRSSGGLQVPRQVQEVMLYSHKIQKESTRYWEKVVKVLRETVIADKLNVEGIKRCNDAIVHIKHLRELSNKIGLSGKQELELAALLEVSGLHQQTMGNYEVARAFQEQALEIRERSYGPDHPEVASTLVNLGKAYRELGDVGKQKELLKRALIILERHYGPDHEKVAITLEDLGNAYASLGDVRKQKKLLERALIILERHYRGDHIEMLRTLVNLGTAYSKLGDVGKQKELLKRALMIKERHYGPDHIEVAITLGNLGNAYGALGDALKQKELLERALIILEQHYGPDHPEVAITLGNLGNAYGALGDALKQKELLERALIVLERRYGSDHEKVAITLGNLGNAYAALGDALKEKKLLERALIILERHYGRDHVEVVRTLVNLGLAYGKLGDVCKKKDLLERALTIKEQHYGPDHVEVVRRLVGLGRAYRELGDVGKQKELLKRALIILERYYGPDHVQVASILHNLAYACLDLKQLSEAKNYAQRYYHLSREYHGESHSNTQIAKALLQKCELQMVGE